jgi:H(+)-translocating pyrophosphatase
LILGSALFGIFWGLVNALLVKGIKMENTSNIKKVIEEDKKLNGEGLETVDEETLAVSDALTLLGERITNGAKSFLFAEYFYLGIFSGVFAIILGCTVDYLEINREEYPTNFPYTAIAFLVGAATSIAAGYIGMIIAVYTNTRTCFQCCESTHHGFIAAFRGGQVLGFILVGLALLVLHLILISFKSAWFEPSLEALLKVEHTKEDIQDLVRRLFELVAGYGLGASSVALFGRVGGGIYTKAADVGADLVGKVYKDLEEDDPSNPGTIADNVGDNVGDIAGMGADLFGSLAESTCAALVVSSTSYELIVTTDALYFPLMITSAGLVASFLSVLMVHFFTVTEKNVQTVLKSQLGISTVLMTFALIPLVYTLPKEFKFPNGVSYKENGDDIEVIHNILTVTNW